MGHRPKVSAKNIQLLKEYIREKKCSELGAKEMQVKTTVRYHYRLSRLVKI